MVRESQVISQQISETGAWQKVKIKGNVASEDGYGLEGLIGLEVLKTYDPVMIKKDRKSLMKKTRRDAAGQVSSKKAKLSKEHLLLDYKKSEKPKKKKKKGKNRDEEGSAHEQTYAGRFVLLNPPKNVDDVDTQLDVDDLEGWNGLGIPNEILMSLAEKGFKSPTEIQAKTLPAAILGKKDILGAAETGSGKTLAFGIAVLTGIMELKSRNHKSGIRKTSKRIVKSGNRAERDNLTPPPEELIADPSTTFDNEFNNQTTTDDKPLYALILTPTRELAVQIKDHLVAAAKYTGITIATIFGGLSIAKQERVLRSCPEIIVATPGRLWELLQQNNPHLSKIDDISFLVIDETDRMVEKGHFEELKLLLQRLNSNEEKKGMRQNFIFSATLTLVHDLPHHIQKRNLGKKTKLVKQTPGLKIQGLIQDLGISQPKIVDITTSSQTAHTLTECRIICPIDYKDYYLYYFIQRHPGRTIVFCNSIDCVKRLATLFGLLGCRALPLHATMIQKQRLKNLERFRDSSDGLLIATDVAARGLDIPKVAHVIHYQVPRTSENYVHRSGRTARANRDGITVIIMEPGEVKNYLKLCKTLDRSEDLPLFPVSDKYMAAVKERVNLARDVDKMELKLRRTQTEIGWMTKNAEEMEIIVEGKSDSDDSDEDDALVVERKRDRLRLHRAREQLKKLVGRTIFPKGFSYKYPTSTGKLEVPSMAVSSEEDTNSAVAVMKKAIVDMKIAKKMRNKKKA